MRSRFLATLVLALAGGAVALELPAPPWPPPPGASLPPPDPSPALYRRGPAGPGDHLLTLVAEEAPPSLKSGKPCTIKARPHDIIQAPGDPKPIEGRIRREFEGKIWFYDLKGIGHRKNPLNVADLLVFERQAATVEEAYQQRSERAGNDPKAHLALAQECLDGDLLPQAEAELRIVLKLDPKDLPAALKLADLYAAQGKLDAEVGVYRSALAAGLDVPEVHRRLAKRCLALGLFETAASHFDRALGLAAKRSAGDVAAGKAGVPENAEAFSLLRRVAECWLLARRPEAERLIGRLLDARDDDPPARNLRALADILAGRLDRARQTLQGLVRAPGAPASARNNLGALLLASGDPGGAVGEFEAALATAPHHFKAISNLALAHAAASRLDEADKTLSHLSEIRAPRSLGSLLATAYVRERQGRAGEALTAYDEALRLDRCLEPALLGSARCLLASGKPREAEERLQTLLVLSPGNSQALRLIAFCRSATGEFGEAAAALDKLLGQKPEPTDLVIGALVQMRLPGGAARAERLLAEAARLAPDDPYVLVARAWLAAWKGKDREAEQLLIQASNQKGGAALSRYVADALAKIRAARGEVVTTAPFTPTEPPPGWVLTGSGEPKFAVVGGALRFEGRAAERVRWEMATNTPSSRQAADGGEISLQRLAATIAAPLANRATVGLRVGFGTVAFELALRTEHKPRFARRLAYRIVRNQAASPWVDLPVTVATERFQLGLGVGGKEAAVEAWLDGRRVGEPIPLDEVARRPAEFTLAVFAEAEPGAECFVLVRRVELLWQKKVAVPEGPFK